jgi:hypothetical protein
MEVEMARSRWSSRTVFVMAAIGSAVGLGNVWRFPYLTYKFGGGAFLIPYLACLFLLGIPLLMVEFAIGQRFQRGPVGTFASLHRRPCPLAALPERAILRRQAGPSSGATGTVCPAVAAGGQRLGSLVRVVGDRVDKAGIMTRRSVRSIFRDA